LTKPLDPPAARGMPALLRTLGTALARTPGLESGAHLLVAVSGGPDSTALLAGLAELAPGRGLVLTAGHVEHGLRGAAGAAESRAVQALAARLGLACVVRAATVAPGPGVEARARRARYRALASMATAVGATHIATGHTQDDQVETVLLRLLRGSGRGGLGAMRPVRGRLVRPLLGVSRADVRRFLVERDLDFARDLSNADLRFTRNRIRRLLLPLLQQEFNPRLAPALAALAERWREEEDFLAAAAAARAAEVERGDALAVSVATLPPALGRRIVRAWLERGTRRAMSAAHVARVLALAGGRGRGAVAVPGPARVRREGGVLVRRPGRTADTTGFAFRVEPGSDFAAAGGEWRLALSPARTRRAGEDRPSDTAHALFDADALPGELLLRSPRPGDRLELLAGGTRKLQDVLVDAKVPREARRAVPVLVGGGRILWVAGVARGVGAAITPATTRVVEGVIERHA
jgi:tRNA(Ile)-lysidine synthase